MYALESAVRINVPLGHMNRAFKTRCRERRFELRFRVLAPYGGSIQFYFHVEISSPSRCDSLRLTFSASLSVYIFYGVSFLHFLQFVVTDSFLPSLGGQSAHCIFVEQRKNPSTYSRSTLTGRVLFLKHLRYLAKGLTNIFSELDHTLFFHC